jgi:hypothetical protein
VARARDAGGNVTEAMPLSFEIGAEEGTVSPIEVAVTASAAGGTVTFEIDIRSEEQVSLTNIFLDGEFLGGRADAQEEYTFTRDLPAGTHRLLVDVTDVSGNSAQGEVTIDI